MPNLRRYARGRPQSLQRSCLRVENLGFWAWLSRARLNFSSIFASLTRFAVVMKSLKKFLSSNLETLEPSLRPERHAEAAQESARFVVIPRCSHNGDIHTFLLVDLGVIDLRKDQLIAQAEGVIAAAIKRLAGTSAQIAYARQHYINQPIEEFVGTVAAQGDHRTDRLSFAHLESRNRLLRLGDDRFLSGDLTQLSHRRIEHLRVLRGLAHTHVHDDFVQPRNRHGIF